MNHGQRDSQVDTTLVFSETWLLEPLAVVNNAAQDLWGLEYREPNEEVKTGRSQPLVAGLLLPGATVWGLSSAHIRQGCWALGELHLWLKHSSFERRSCPADWLNHVALLGVDCPNDSNLLHSKLSSVDGKAHCLPKGVDPIGQPV